MKHQILTALAAILLGTGAMLTAGCQGPDSAPADSAAAYDRAAGVPDKSAGAPYSVEHVGNQSHAATLGGGSVNDPNAATPGGG